jgi:hypothetical protein
MIGASFVLVHDTIATGACRHGRRGKAGLSVEVGASTERYAGASGPYSTRLAVGGCSELIEVVRGKNVQ